MFRRIRNLSVDKDLEDARETKEAFFQKHKLVNGGLTRKQYCQCCERLVGLEHPHWAQSVRRISCMMTKMKCATCNAFICEKCHESGNWDHHEMRVDSCAELTAKAQEKMEANEEEI